MTIYSGWFPCVIASSAKLSGAVALGKPYDFLEVIVPTLTSCDLSLHVAESVGGTYQQLGGTSVVKAASTGGFTDVWKLLGFENIKINSSTTQGAERTFQVRGGRF